MLNHSIFLEQALQSNIILTHNFSFRGKFNPLVIHSLHGQSKVSDTLF